MLLLLCNPSISAVSAPPAGSCLATLTSVTHDLVSESTAAKHPAPDLVRQTLREIGKADVVLAATRGVPFEKPARYDQSMLDREFAGTKAFLSKQLSKDPRLQPSDIVVTTDHMSQCTSCTQDEGLKTALHGGDTRREIAQRTQLLVDDWLIHEWSNVVRFLEPPADKRQVPVAARQDVRFGCPCSVYETEDGKVQLAYSSGPHDPDPEVDLNNKYSFRTSADGEV